MNMKLQWSAHMGDNVPFKQENGHPSIHIVYSHLKLLHVFLSIAHTLSSLHIFLLHSVYALPHRQHHRRKSFRMSAFEGTCACSFVCVHCGCWQKCLHRDTLTHTNKVHSLRPMYIYVKCVVMVWANQLACVICVHILSAVRLKLPVMLWM